MPTSRATLRRRVAERLGDYKRVIATSDAGTNAFVDDKRLTGGENTYAGRELLIVSAVNTDNVGEVRFVPGSSMATKTLTLDPSLPQPTKIGDVGELFNERGRGWLVEEYHNVINDTLAIAQEHASVELLEDVPGTFDQTTQTVVIPSTIDDLADVLYRVGENDDLPTWCSVSPARNASAPGWWLLPGRLVQINGPDRTRAHGKAIRLVGYGDPPLLASDADVTTVPTEWLVHQASASLLYGGIDREAGGERRTRWRDEQALADSRRGLLFTLFHQNTQPVVP